MCVGVKSSLSPCASPVINWQPVFQLMTMETHPQSLISADGKQMNGLMDTQHLCSGLAVNKGREKLCGSNCCVGVYWKIFWFCTRAVAAVSLSNTPGLKLSLESLFSFIQRVFECSHLQLFVCLR